MGFLVKDEAFDEFTPAKNKWVAGWNSALPSHFGYAEDFEQWSVRDIQDMVRRDRNHPSIILWSIGNEIDYANDPFSHPVLGDNYRPENPSAENLVKLGRPLAAAVKELDSTRPVTAARANVLMSDAVAFGELLDVDGYNYQEQRYATDHAKFPKRILYGSETSHGWDAWLAVRDNDYVCGQFLWTGIDYLGEASRWPNHGSSAGLLDTCGFKKPLAWWRQSLWSDQPMVYMSASLSDSNTNRGRMRFRSSEGWNWPENSKVNVRCVTTCPEVQLSLNGKVIETKRRSDAVEGVLTFQVPYEPGTLTAVGLNNGKQVAEFSLKTAGRAHHIELLPDTKQLSADGKDVSHVEFRIVDEQGNRVADAANEVTFSIEGRGIILGIDNGDLNSTESYKDHVHRAFQGRGLLILQSKLDAGSITLKASSPDLISAEVSLSSR
jgi:beta-galactosidase